MATRSAICTIENDKIIAIYCHWDGYPAHVGRMLLNYYNTPAKVKKLISMGGISSLQPKMTRAKGHTFDSPIKGHTVFYHRDRGEDLDVTIELNTPKAYTRIANNFDAEFVYLWNGKQWTYAPTPDKGKFKFTPLTPENTVRETVSPNIPL